VKEYNQDRLDSIADVISGYAFKSSWFDSGVDKIIRIGDIQNGKINISSAKTFDNHINSVSNSFKVKENDILMALSGATTGKIGIVDKTSHGAYLNQRVALIRGKSKENKAYLKFVLSGQYLNKLLLNAGGAAQANLSPKALSSLKIPLPPLDIQKKIATVLDKTDQLRQKRKETIEKLDQLIQSVFLDMFGDPVTNPKGWDKKPGSQYCDSITVGVVVKPASYYVEDGVPALRSLNIRKNKIELDNLVFFSKDSNENKLKKSQLKTDDVLIVRSGQPGTAAVLPEKLNGINCIDLIIARPKKSIITPIYLSHFFNSEGGKMLVMSSERGQIQKHLNIGEVKKSLIPVPPIDIQDDFVKQIKTIEEQKQNLKTHLKQFDTLFNSLLQQAFKGELKFNDKAFKELEEEVMN
jgi:type I restriction enzyme, S subunit